MDDIRPFGLGLDRSEIKSESIVFRSLEVLFENTSIFESVPLIFEVHFTVGVYKVLLVDLLVLILWLFYSLIVLN